MKKLLLTTLVIFGIITPAFAKNVKVEALEDFSTANPPKTWQVKIVDGFTTKDGFTVCTGAIIEGRIENITGPKRLKQNAQFTFIPEKYYDTSNDCLYEINKRFEAKYSPLTDVNAKSVAKTGAVFVGNRLLDGFFGPGVALVEGAVKNEEGNRAKSAAVSVYESTPFSYINKGKELEISKGQIFVMNFKLLDEE